MMAGLILAGGRATRMGGADKALTPFAGKPLIEHVLDRLSGQLSRLAISANGDPGRFASYGLPVLADPLAGFPGPLAGILAGLEWVANHHPECRWMLSVPCDAPFLPRDLAANLRNAVEKSGARLAMAQSRGHRHPVATLWPVDLVGELRKALIQEDFRKVGQFAARYSLALVPFEDEEGRDPFANLNTPEDLKTATSP